MVRKLITTLALGAFVAFATGSVASAADKCTISKESADNPVAKACKKGGIPEAKKVMKAMVASAKKAGFRKDCVDCHKGPDDANFALTADGEKLFQELLAKQK
jgi:hypothetical protein